MNYRVKCLLIIPWPGLARLLSATLLCWSVLTTGAETKPGLLEVSLSNPSTYDNLIEDLRRQPKIVAALQFIEHREAASLKALIDMTEVAAPPFQEQNRALHFAALLREAGLNDVRIDAVGNVIGRRAGEEGRRRVVYSAHLDTVFPAETDVSVRVEGDKYYAPGIGDNARGLVTLIEVLRALEQAKIKTRDDIWFVANVGEEGLGDLRGIKHLFRDVANERGVDVFIAIDGSAPERLVYGAVGSHRYRVTFKGPGGHSWGAFGDANPHHALGRAIHHFVEAAPSVTAFGEKTSYNIGRISGGTSINSIPFESWMEVDMRSLEQGKLDDIDEVFQAAVSKALEEENKARLTGQALTVEIKRVGQRPAGRGDISAPVVQKAMAAIRAYGLSPKLKISSTDANIPISKGIPAITMSGGGRSGRAHSLDEWWQNDNAIIGPKIGLITLLAVAGFVPGEE